MMYTDIHNTKAWHSTHAYTSHTQKTVSSLILETSVTGGIQTASSTYALKGKDPSEQGRKGREGCKLVFFLPKREKKTTNKQTNKKTNKKCLNIPLPT